MDSSEEFSQKGDYSKGHFERGLTLVDCDNMVQQIVEMGT